MNGIRTTIAAVTLCASAVPVSQSAAATLDRIRDSQAIVIAHREASLPFSYMDGRQPVGYAIDLCLKVADAIKRELKLAKLDVRYLAVTPSNRMQAIAEGKADLECGSTTNTAERRKQVAFTVSHFVASARMVVRTDSGIANWADLRDKKIVTTRGTTNAKTLVDRDKVRSLNITLAESKDHAEGFGMVERGVADAFAMDDVLLYGLRAAARNPESFRVVGDSLSTEPYAIMLRKDDPAFKAVVDRELARIMNDGEIYPIYDKWFRQPIPPSGINMNMPMGYLLRSSLRFPTDKVGDN
ncbi:amino acid ABC transporter substrate-binding protein [Noviherbaspirillum sp.]|uniref:amino acid ABC transporter substrate-binding protein n=1 Tax=Noviherbaspirillum sp. TaxID=1926288 RepID=UPI002FE24192